jgi:hypothetical protein
LFQHQFPTIITISSHEYFCFESALDGLNNDPIYNGDDFNVDFHYSADKENILSIPGKKYLDE